MSNYTTPSPDATRQVMELAKMLVHTAKGAGLVVTIGQQPMQPLAMGNNQYQIEVRPERRHNA